MIYCSAVSLRPVRVLQHVRAHLVGKEDHVAQASKSKASEKDAKNVAKAPIDTEEILDDDETLDVEPDVSAADTLDEDKLETSLDEDEDLLEGIPEEELKATVEVQLPRVGKSLSLIHI